jgi:hypothetical protein
MATPVNTSRALDNSLDLKFLAIGDSGVGKVSYSFRIISQKFRFRRLDMFIKSICRRRIY